MNAGARRGKQNESTANGAAAGKLNPKGRRARTRLLRYAARRRLWDRTARAVVSIGGLGIISSILLIFFYLVYEVLPLFGGADAGVAEILPQVVTGEAVWLEADTSAGVALRIDEQGLASFYDLNTGNLLDTEALAVPAGAALTAIARDSAGTGLFAAGFDDGSVLVAGWNTTLEAGSIIPQLEYPLGPEPQAMLDGEALRALGLRSVPGGISIAAAGNGGPVVLLEQPVASGPPGLPALPRAGVENRQREFFAGGIQPERILLPQDPRWMLLMTASGELHLIAIGAGNQAETLDTAQLASASGSPGEVRLLAGGMSLIAAAHGGRVTQWFIVSEDGRASLEPVREFDLFDSAIAALDVERGRRVFAAVSARGEIALVNVTAETVSYPGRWDGPGARAAAFAPAGDLLLLEDAAGGLTQWRINNPHPEFSLSALWSETWYENYPEPALVWQTTAADDALEPKYSLAPLTFGTLKAALCAMLFAAPLAISAAVFTGYFMPPGARRQIKPLIELMEALPTVVIGFLAGLWLAPLVDASLMALALGALLLPLGVLLASLAMARLPERLDLEWREGWQVLALAPVLLLAGVLAWLSAPLVEGLLFDGSLRDWLVRRWGLDYVSRNALIVGAAMGFAVIPAIYSIADDAIFTVPRHLGNGALAIGANRWQTLSRLILPAAAPGILSALMIGFGRAIGETMIVLMATGNTPIMDANLFEGMRSLAANLAIEIPESEVGSSHYRILFLASLVLLLFTFVINSAAELVRQRLRRKYRMI